MMMRIILFLMMIVADTTSMAAKLESIKIQNEAQKATAILTLNGVSKYKSYALTQPFRAVLDLEQTHTTIHIPSVLTHSGLIQRVRSGNPDPHTLRLVFDVKQGVAINVFPVGLNRSSLRIELTPKTLPLKTVNSTVVKQVHVKPLSQSSYAHVKPLRDVIVVIDPGHGGKDPGAIGLGRSAEKHVVLAIALKLKQLIDKQPGMRAVLTRHGDYYIGLRERMIIARRHNADIFVAIHADAFRNHESNGASVFALSPRGATSEAARWLAAKENHSELGGVNLSGLDDQNGIIRTVLLDLSQTATIGASLQMGTSVLQNMDTITRLHNNKVEQARFVVLKSPDIPSILIETGFISNAREERNLTSPYYQTRLTQAIFKGLKTYFWNNPPHGTHLEAMLNTRVHWVRAGESLPSIASKYHVPVARLKQVNGLSGLSLKSGQKLSIPASWG